MGEPPERRLETLPNRRMWFEEERVVPGSLCGVRDGFAYQGIGAFLDMDRKGPRS